jgi:spore germination cell wall hydrolase CwlJ-like protein
MTANPPTDARLAQALAQAVFRYAGGASVRVIEAIAVASANRLRQLSRKELACWPALVAGPDGRPQDPIAEGGRCPARLAMCARVARRALSASLPDPTGGATAFHEAGTTPAWSFGQAPVAEFGPLLFYRL